MTTTGDADRDKKLHELAHQVERLANNTYSPNEADSNGEAANLVDGLFAIARSIDRLSEALSGLDRLADTVAAFVEQS